jgi:DNA ligase (NAD+)
MGSQDKALNEAEFNSWVKSNALGGISLHASHKMDGGSFSLEYQDGRLISAISRGDGMVGEDITANAIRFKNIPPSAILPNGKMFSGFIRGEVVLTTDDWMEVDPNQTSNPRNLAVGIARRKDGSQAEYLKFYAFRVFDADGELYGDTEQDLSQVLIKMGFNIAPYITGKADDVWKWYQKVFSERQSLPYWIDGIVVKVNDLEKQLKMGTAGNECPKGQIAIKFEAEGGTTILRDVTYQVGCTGAIVPVAHFDVVRIGGTNITNATLCNWDYISALDVCIGDEISVIKAGDIIPRIMEVTKKGNSRVSIPKPVRCPVCGGKVGHKSNVSGDESTTIYCLNSKCPAVVSGRIERYVKSLDIQGIGSNLIESLVKSLNVSDPSDLYILRTAPAKLADLILSGGGRFGEKRAEKVLEEIEKKRELTLSDFLGSLGIFGLGKRRVVLIQTAVPGLLDTLDDWFTPALVQYAQQAGVPNIAGRIHDELMEQKDTILRYITNGVVIKKNQPKAAIRPGANVICITGALSRPKSYFQSLIEKRGDVYTDTFSKSVTHLVAADVNSGSAKLKKAAKQGTKIINEDELFALITQ